MSEHLTFREELARCSDWREELRVRLRRMRERQREDPADTYSVRQAIADASGPGDLLQRADSYDQDAAILEQHGDHDDAASYRRIAGALREAAGETQEKRASGGR